MVWKKNGTPLTLGSALDDIDITDLTAKKFNVFLNHNIHSGSCTEDKNFNNNSNSVYAQRRDNAHGGDVTATSQTTISTLGGEPDDRFEVIHGCSISGEEKLFIGSTTRRATAGAGTAPSNSEWVAKFVPSPSADITRIDIHNSDAGSYDTNSNLSAFGTDDGDSNYIIQDGAVFEETDTNKHYLYSSTTGLWTEVT